MEKKRFKKIYIELTNSCNLNCSFCTEDSRQKKMINVSEFKEIIQRIKGYTNLVAFHVKGEPLLHPNLKELLDECEKNGIVVNITTNGTLLHKQLDILKSSKALRQLNISIHSIYDKNILKGKENPENFQYEYMKNVFDSVSGITKSNNIYISYRLWNLANKEEKLKNERIIKLISKEYNHDNLEADILNHDGVKLDTNIYLNQDIAFKWPSILDEDIQTNGTCQGLKSQIAILSNGDVVPCCLDQDAHILLGNIFKSSLEEILSTRIAIDMLNGFNNGKLIQPLCKKCDYIKKFKKNE